MMCGGVVSTMKPYTESRPNLHENEWLQFEFPTQFPFTRKERALLILQCPRNVMLVAISRGEYTLLLKPFNLMR